MSRTKKILIILLAMFSFLAIFSLKSSAATSAEKAIVFDAKYYLNRYSDLKKAFGNDYTAAYNHFINYGLKEGRTGSLLFDVKSYLKYYPDLKKAFGNDYKAAYEHFLNYGLKEGRMASPIFDVKSYLSNYPDLKKAFGNDYVAAYNHFINYGMKEGRVTSASFFIKTYINNYPDLKKAFGNDYTAAYEHYMNYGMKEGRVATHIHSYIAKITEPTATEQGFTTFTCSCGNSYVGNYVPALEIEEDVKPNETPDVTPSEPEEVVPSETPSSPSKEPQLLPETDSNELPTIIPDSLPGEKKEPEPQEVKPNTAQTPSKSNGHVHQFSEWETITESACNRYGERQRKCNSCGYVEKERLKTLAAHVLHYTYYVPATCTERARQYSECSVCGQVFFGLREQALGHDYSKNVTEAATCQKEGASYTKCSRCDSKINVKTTPKVGHNYETKIVEPTCTKDGLKTQSCTMCGKVISSQFVSRTGHNYKEEVVGATCIQGGTITKTCLNCGDVKTQKIEGTAHKWINEKVITSTCTGSITEHECSYCGLKETIQSDFAGTGHKWADPNGNTGFENNYCLKCHEKAPNWTNTWATTVYRSVFEKVWKEDKGYDYPSDSLPDVYRLSPSGIAKFREEIKKSGGDRTRVVWYVGFHADTATSYGFENGKDFILKTVITADWKFEVTAPDPKPGYKFTKWVNKATREEVSTNKTLVTSWRDKDKTFEALYERI